MEPHAANILAVIAEGLRAAAPGMIQRDQQKSSWFDEAKMVVRTPDGQEYRILVAKIG